MAAVTSNLSQFAPVYQPISIKAPSEVEKFASKVLKTYIDLAYPQESTESRQAREKVLAKVEKLLQKYLQLYLLLEVPHFQFQRMTAPMVI